MYILICFLDIETEFYRKIPVVFSIFGQILQAVWRSQRGGRLGGPKGSLDQRPGEAARYLGAGSEHDQTSMVFCAMDNVAKPLMDKWCFNNPIQWIIHGYFILTMKVGYVLGCPYWWPLYNGLYQWLYVLVTIIDMLHV